MDSLEYSSGPMHSAKVNGADGHLAHKLKLLVGEEGCYERRVAFVRPLGVREGPGRLLEFRFAERNQAVRVYLKMNIK